MEWIVWILIVIAIEAVAKIVTSSKLFESFRETLSATRRLPWNFLGDLFSCGYCFSVWLAFVGAILATWVLKIRFTESAFLDWFLHAMALHRASNLAHGIFRRIEKKPLQIDDEMFPGFDPEDREDGKT